MDVITLTNEIKETIDLDEISPDELKKVVKHLWHKVAELSIRIDIGRYSSNMTCTRGNADRSWI